MKRSRSENNKEINGTEAKRKEFLSICNRESVPLSLLNVLNSIRLFAKISKQHKSNIVKFYSCNTPFRNKHRLDSKQYRVIRY